MDAATRELTFGFYNLSCLMSKRTYLSKSAKVGWCRHVGQASFKPGVRFLDLTSAIFVVAKGEGLRCEKVVGPHEFKKSF